MKMLLLSVMLVISESVSGVVSSIQGSVDPSECATCTAALSNIREALRVLDHSRIQQLLNCIDNYLGIDRCADELCVIAAETEDIEAKLLFDSRLIRVPRIVRSAYGCNMTNNAVDTFLHPEKYDYRYAPLFRLCARGVLEGVFRLCGYSTRPIFVYEFIQSEDIKQITQNDYSKLGGYFKELSDSEVFHIYSIHRANPMFLTNADCGPLRERFAEIESEKRVLHTREDLLRTLQKQIELYATNLCDEYGDKEAEPFSGVSRGRGDPVGL